MASYPNANTVAGVVKKKTERLFAEFRRKMPASLVKAVCWLGVVQLHIVIGTQGVSLLIRVPQLRILADITLLDLAIQRQ
jgi:hypothetical protein